MNTTPKWVYSLSAIHEELNKATLGHAAEAYAELGFPIFPLTPGSKIPYPESHGVKDAKADKDAVVRFWAKHPNANIGLATGVLTSVLDVDTKGAVNGWVAADKLDSHGLLSGAYARIVSPSRGSKETGYPEGGHLYFAPAGGGHSHKSGLDYKAGGGYVLLPPSVITEGPAHKQGRYLWAEVEPTAFGEPLDWDSVKAILDPPKPRANKRATAPKGDISGLDRRLRNAVEGERHEVLLWAVCRAVEGGHDPMLLADAAAAAERTDKELADAIAWAHEQVGGAL